MAIKIENGSTTVEQTFIDPRTLRVTYHATCRDTEFRAHFNPAKPDDKHGDHPAYIDVGVTIGEKHYETPEGERREGRSLVSAELVGFLSIEQARALLDALKRALDCAEVK